VHQIPLARAYAKGPDLFPLEESMSWKAESSEHLVPLRPAARVAATVRSRKPARNEWTPILQDQDGDPRRLTGRQRDASQSPSGALMWRRRARPRTPFARDLNKVAVPTAQDARAWSQATVPRAAGRNPGIGVVNPQSY
jgi:hypothetical protein